MDDVAAIASLPDDPAILKQIIATRTRDRDEWHVKFLRAEMELLRLKKWYYGPKADRLTTPGDVAQMLLEFAADLEARPVNPQDLPPEDSSGVVEVGTVRRVRRGRRNLAAYESLPVTRQVHDLADNEKPCPCCGKMRERIGEETSWQVEFIPGRFERIEHVRIKYACKRCEQNADNPQITLAEKPLQAIDKGMAGPGLLAHVVTSKFADYLPLYRLQNIFERNGFEIDRATQSVWCGDVVVGNDITRAGCWAHARRKFVDAEKTQPQIAQEAVGIIRQLYAGEHKGKDLGYRDRLCLRQAESQPILSHLQQRLWAWKDQLLPKHPMSEAVNYTLNQWGELNVFATDGAVPIDNNVSERDVKRIVLNRKNSLFVGNERGGRTAAILSSLTSTCKRHKIDPQRYLTQLLVNLPATPISQITRWLPDQWKLQNPSPSG